jgi:hypothetical protein
MNTGRQFWPHGVGYLLRPSFPQLSPRILRPAPDHGGNQPV